jgi:hypothetical protein
MNDDPRDHISDIDGRSHAETGRLVARMQRFCWPGGSSDRSEPGAIGWVRRWRPARFDAVIPVCSCAQGRCAMCN